MLPHPSLRRCWGWRGARCGARCWWRARLGAGSGSSWRSPRGRYVLCPTLLGGLLEDTEAHEGVAGRDAVGQRAVARESGVGVTVLTVVSSFALQASPK